MNEELDTSAAVASYLGTRKPEQVLHTSLTLAGAANPDAEAEFQRLSKAAGLPIDSVRDNAPAVKQRLAMPDTADLAAKFPSTTKYLSNIENARIAHDDVGSLTAIEKGIRSFMNGGGMKKEAGQALSFLGEGVKQISLGATVGLGAGMFDLAAMPLDLLSTATKGMLPQDIPGMLAADYRERAKRARAAMDEVSDKPEGNVAKGFQSGFRSAGQNLALLPLGIAAGTEAMLAGMVGMVGSQAYGDAREKGMAPVGALTYAIPQSVFEYAFEKLPASRLLEDIAKHSSLGTIVARQLGPEVLGEQATTVLQDLNEWVRLNPQKTAREFLEERPGAAMQTLVATLVGVGVQGGAVRGVQKVLGGAAEREATAQRAEASATRAQEFAGQVEQSKLGERDRGALTEFIASVAESGTAPVEFFIDAEQLANSLNQSAISLEELRAVAPQVAAQLDAAQHVPGADIRVPVAEFAAVNSDITTRLIDHLREAPDAMSRAEAQTFMKEQGDRIKKDVESALGEETRRAAAKVGDDVVRKHFEDQLNAVGKFRPEVNQTYGAFMSAYYNTQAGRAGMPVADFLQRYQLKVATKEGALGKGQRLEQGGALDVAGANTAVEALTRAGLGNLKLVESVDQLPESAQRKIKSEGQAGTRGMYDPETDATYLVRQNIASLDEAFWVGLHEAFHRGLRKTVGAEVEPLLMAIHDGNPRVQALAARYMEQQNIPLAEAIEEVLADMAGQGEVGSLKGWDQLLAFLKDAITKLAAAAGVKLEVTDQMVTDLVAGMRRAGMQDHSGDVTNVVSQGPKGTLSFGNDITAVPSIIALMEGADLSTFLHEGGHFFLEVQADLAARIQRRTFNEQYTAEPVSDSEKQIVKDMEAILGWFGITGTPEQSALDTWASMTLEEKREHHEKWARGFERYAMEGKAPSQDLQALFSKFRAWLVSVYKALAGLNVDLTPEVRQVMDRMLASDEAIAEAQMARNMGPLFESPEAAGMTPVQYQEYQALGERQTAEASAQLDARLLKDMKWLSKARDKAMKARQDEVEDLRREVRMEVTRDVMSTDVYRAWSFLTAKLDRVDGTKTPKQAGEEHENLFTAIGRLGGLDREAVKAAWGLDAKNDSFKSGIFGKPVLRKEGGLSIDAMAERLVEAGYLLPDENGKADLAKFETLFDDQRRGVDRFSVRKDYAGAQGEAPVDPLEQPDETAGRLNTDELKRMYGEKADAKWRLLSERRMTSPTGLSPDVVAETFGFQSGDQLVNSLVRAPDPKQLIEELVDQQMLERYGDITSDAALAQAADEAVHNLLRTKVIVAELKALERATKRRETGDSLISRQTVDVMAKAAEEHANNVIARQRIKDLRPAQYTAAAARNARLAKAALGKSLEESAMHVRNELVNNFAAKAAYGAKTEVKDGLAFFRKVTSGAQDKVAKSRDFDVVQAARAILADYGIGTRGEKAQAYLEAVERNDPHMHKVLADVVNRLTLNAKPLNELTVEEFRGLREEIEGLWHMAKRSRQIAVDGKLIDIERAKLDLLTRIQEIGIPDRVPGEGRAVTDGERRVARLRSLGAALRRVESWVGAKDGSEAMGPFRRFVWQPVKEAADSYRTDKAKYLRLYRDLLTGLEVGESRIDATAELGYTFGFSRGGSGKAEILHAVLHTGNASNKRKLLLGRGWAQVLPTGELDTSRWDSFVNRMIREGVLTRKDFDFAQGVWDLLEGMKPLAQKAHRDIFGRYFDEVTADSFTVQFADGPGIYRGGYVPAIMDPEVVKDAATRALQEDENATLAYAFPSTPKGFMQNRVEINKPLLLDLRLLSSHIDKVLLFSHLEAPIRDVRKVLTSKEVSEPLHRIDPAAFDGILTPWLNRAARQTVEAKVPGDNNLMRFFSKARSRAGMAAMFANLTNAAQQVTGLSIAAVKVKPSHLVHAMGQWAIAPRQTNKAVASASQYMAGRMDNEVAAMNEAIDDILLNPSTYEKAQSWAAKHAYFLQSAVDNVIGPVIWVGAYNQALEAGHWEADAVRLADSAVRETQGSTLPEDVSRIETGNAFVRMFTQFAGYFNMQANLLGTEFSKAQHDLGLRRGMGRGLYVFTMGFLVPAMVSELIVQAFRGGPGDDDKDGSTLDDWLMAVLVMANVRGALAMVPGVGQAVNAAINTFNRKPYDDRISTAPAVSMIESAVSAPHSVYKAVVEDGNQRKAVRDLATLISMTTGLPANAIARPVGYLVDVAQGKTRPTSEADAVRGVVTGTSSPESKQ